MAPRPEVEKPPGGLRGHWLATWEQALSTMKDQGTWHPVQRPLLDEYVYASQAAEAAREAGEDAQWDRHVRRARALARDLVLTREAQRLYGISGEREKKTSPFAGFAPPDDEIAKKRAAKRGA
jgi:hypothetical protein